MVIPIGDSKSQKMKLIIRKSNKEFTTQTLGDFSFVPMLPKKTWQLLLFLSLNFKLENMKLISVIGAGTMGNGIAHAFAQSGYKVNLIDLSSDALDRAIQSITKNLDRQLAKEKISDLDKANTLSNIKISTDLVSSVKGADLVVEAATENIDIKLSIFKQLDEVCDSHTILGTNTSSISITKIASVTKKSW